jgi:hypothetical protein
MIITVISAGLNHAHAQARQRCGRASRTEVGPIYISLGESERMLLKPGFFGAIAALGTGLFLSASPAAATILPGDTLSITFLFPDANTVFSGPVETQFMVSGASLPIFPGFQTGTATFTADSVLLSQSAPHNVYPIVAFDGIKIADITNPAAFAGWTVQPGATFPSFTEFQSDGAIFVNLEGNRNIEGDITIGGAVPEPSTWAMMVLGFAGLGLMIYRRRRRALA